MRGLMGSYCIRLQPVSGAVPLAQKAQFSGLVESTQGEIERAVQPSAHGQGVFGMTQGVDSLRELKRFAEHRRLEPAISLARGAVVSGRASKNVESNRLLPGVHEPVFDDSRF